MPALNILLVDDNPADRKLIRRTVGKAYPHSSFDEASQRQEFMQAIANTTYDLIITDYIMRAFDGLEVIDMVKAQDVDVPIIMVTGTGNEEVAIEAMHRGVADYVIKQQATFKLLPDTIDRVLRRSQARLDLKQSQADLRDSEARKSAILNTTLDCIVCVDGMGNITEFNPAAERLFAYQRHEILGQNMAELLIPTDKQFFCEFGFVSFIDCIHPHAAGARFESEVLQKNAHIIAVEVTQTADHVLDELIVTFSIRDLSERKRLEQQFLQSQKMEAIGTLVGGIAHDFNNMLAGITGNTHLAMIYCQGNDKAVQKIKNIESLSFRAADMIKQLLTFARKGFTRREDLDLSVFVRNFIRLQRCGVPENINFEVKLCDAIHVYADASQLQQLVMNIIGNAVDALALCDDPHITLQLEPMLPDKAFLQHYPDLQAESFAHLQISDNGTGINADIVEHIFEPFFTTKAVGQGTGLGLAMAYGAIKSNKGEIDVESDMGKGTTFNIYLPVIKDATVLAEKRDEPSLAMGHGEWLLLVDDETVVLETGKAVLEKLGYRVLIASNGEEAVEVFEQRKDDIQLVILDVIMPVLGGIEAARKINQLDHQANIIFATGYDSSSMLHQIDVENDVVVQKPYRIAKLSHIIQKRLSDHR